MSFKVRVREERMGCGMLNRAGACYKRVCSDVGVGGRLIEGGYLIKEIPYLCQFFMACIIN